MSCDRNRFLALIPVALASLLCASAEAQDLFIRNARVITCAGPEIAHGCVLIQAGRIAAVGEDLKAPPGTPAVDARGQVVMPGFVLSHTSDGMDRGNEVVQITPYVSVLDAIDPTQTFFEDSLRDGHLTMLVIPGNATVIGGVGRIVNPRGVTVEAMTVVPDAGMKLSLIPQNGNRAAHLAKLRGALDDAKAYLAKKKLEGEAKGETASGNATLDMAAFQIERRKASLVRVLQGEMTAYIACGTAGDVIQALRLAEDYKLKFRLFCGAGTWRAAPALAEKKIPVILSSELEVDEVDPETGTDVHRIIPKIFHDAGVRFSITSIPSSLGRRYLWYQAACLVRYGMKREEALAAVTTVAAEMIGLEGRKGALKPGMDGDVQMLSDDPLSGKAWVDKAWIQGKLAYDRAKDPRLAEVFGREAR